MADVVREPENSGVRSRPRHRPTEADRLDDQGQTEATSTTFTSDLDDPHMLEIRRLKSVER